jgi:hypothetical protein
VAPWYGVVRAKTRDNSKLQTLIEVYEGSCRQSSPLPVPKTLRLRNTQYNVYLLSHLLFRADISPVSLTDSRKDRVDMNQSSPSCSELEARTNNQIAEQQSSVCEHTLAAKPESTRDALETRPSVIPAGISPSTQKRPRPWQPSVGVRSGTNMTSSSLSKTFTTTAFPSILARTIQRPNSGEVGQKRKEKAKPLIVLPVNTKIQSQQSQGMG